MNSASGQTSASLSLTFDEASTTTPRIPLDAPTCPRQLAGTASSTAPSFAQSPVALLRIQSGEGRTPHNRHRTIPCNHPLTRNQPSQSISNTFALSAKHAGWICAKRALLFNCCPVSRATLSSAIPCAFGRCWPRHANFASHKQANLNENTITIRPGHTHRLTPAHPRMHRQRIEPHHPQHRTARRHGSICHSQKHCEL